MDGLEEFAESLSRNTDQLTNNIVGKHLPVGRRESENRPDLSGALMGSHDTSQVEWVEVAQVETYPLTHRTTMVSRSQCSLSR